MTGAEFLRRLRKLAGRSGIKVRVDKQRGKGDHVTVWYGGKRTILDDRKAELKTRTLHGMLKQLGLRLEDLEG